MHAIITWDFQGTEVRTVAGREEWIARDVCDALGLDNVGQALSKLDADEKGSIIISDGSPGNPEHATVTEPGLYSLILRSRKPQAKAFKRWVTHEVLPQIRRTGAYRHGHGLSEEQVVRICTTTIESTTERMTRMFMDMLDRLQAKALEQSSVIGTRYARIIRGRLTAWAKSMFPDDAKVRRSERSAAEMNLRVAVEHCGTGRSWENLPASKWPAVMAKLEELERSAARTGPRAQLALIK